MIYQPLNQAAELIYVLLIRRNGSDSMGDHRTTGICHGKIQMIRHRKDSCHQLMLMIQSIQLRPTTAAGKGRSPVNHFILFTEHIDNCIYGGLA